MAELQFLVAEWPAISHRLDEALSLAPAGRDLWLNSLDESASVKAHLRRLLADASSVAAGDFLGALPKLTRESAADDDDGGDSADGAVSGAIVGPYRLISQLGQGGMGTVWLAERTDGQPRRKVALKLPHVGWAPGLAVRMARERDILASLEHPNIARLYDAGLDPFGRPYLALEYVNGTPIDIYCAVHSLPLRERLALILQVAGAVAHAHTRLVVHRDLKPSNILVDAEGHAHLLDFGIARLVDPSLDGGNEGAQATLTTARALTPSYASPEQIRGEPIGTASDIYSLGVVAFEVLAGVRPYRLKSSLGAVALAEAIIQIDAPLASKATPAEALRRPLRGDVDAILARALAKKVDDRYSTVDALVDDLERHLRGEPVRARPASLGYVSERWVRRHKGETVIAVALVLAAAGGAYAQVLVALALGAGTLAALWQRNQALRQANIARGALARGERVKDFIASIFTQAVPRAGRGGAVMAADLLRAAAHRVETDLAGQPAIAAELSALIGASFNELGEMRAGLDWLPKAVELCTRELGPTHPLTLQSRRRWIEAANSVGELTVSEPLLPALLRDLRAVQPREASLLVEALQSQAFVDAKRGREAAAITALDEAVEVATSHLGEGNERALSARGALSNTLIHFGRPAAALEAISPALAPALAKHGSQRPHPTLTMVERCQGDALGQNQRPRDAVAMLEQVLADQRALDTEETLRVRICMSLLAKALLLGGHVEAAESLFEGATALHDKLTGGANDEGVTQRTWLALCCALRGDGEAALTHLERAAAVVGISDETGVQTRVRGSVRALALATAGHNEPALAAIAAMLGLSPRPWRGTIAVRLLRTRAMALRQGGAIGEASVAASDALSAVDASCSALEHGLSLAEAARCDVAAGQTEEANRRRRETLSVWQAGQVDGPTLLQGIQTELGAPPGSP
ncbi:MAG: serine/threonine protein kinase [Pseudomonadota bacterium]|nr:serine/threonine protein kinase [Pseudomonadota bacterium]